MTTTNPTVSPQLIRLARQRRRLMAMALIESGWSQAKVARELSVSREAVRKWVLMYRGGGADALAARPSPGAPPRMPRSNLAELPNILARGALAFGFPTDEWTSRRVARAIEAEFGVAYHPAHVRRLLRRLTNVRSASSSDANTTTSATTAPLAAAG